MLSSLYGSVSLLSDAWSEGSVSAIVAGSSQEEESSLFCRRLEVLDNSKSRYAQPICQTAFNIISVPLKYTNTYETYPVTTVSAQ